MSAACTHVHTICAEDEIGLDLLSVFEEDLAAARILHRSSVMLSHGRCVEAAYYSIDRA